MGAAQVAVPPPPPGFKMDAVPPPPPGFVMDGAQGTPQEDVADEFARGNAHTLIPGAEDAPAPVRRRPSAIAGAPGAAVTLASAIPATVAGNVAGLVKSLFGGKFGTQEGTREGAKTAQEVAQGLTYEPSPAGGEALDKFGHAFEASKLAGLNPAGPVNALQNPGRAVSRELAGHRAMAPIMSGADDIAAALEGARATKAAEVAPKVAILNRAREANLKLLPTQTNPTMKNRLLEGAAGKTANAQEISEANAPVVNKNLQGHFGVDEPLVPKAINEETGKVEGPLLDVRKREYDEGYRPVKESGAFMLDEGLQNDLNEISSSNQNAAQGFPNATIAKDDVSGIVEGLKQPVYNASSTIDMIRVLRQKSRKAFRDGDEGLGETYVGAANALENRIERHLQEIGQPEMLDRFRKARTTIAQTHDVEPALTPGGDVNSQALAARGKNTNKAPLTGALKTIADFAQEQPKAVQQPSRIGGVPAASPIDTGIALATSSPGKFATALAAIPGRPMLRKYLQSESYQAKNVVPNDYSQPGLIERLARSVAGDREVPPQIRADPNAIQFTGADIPRMIAERLSIAESPPKKFGNEIDPTEFLHSLRLGKGEAVDEAVVDRALQAQALKKRHPPASLVNDFQWLQK